MDNGPKPRRFCCCEGSTWAIIIAVIQIILNTIGVLVQAGTLAIGDLIKETLKRKGNMTITTDITDPLTTTEEFTAIASLAINAAAIVTGIILIFGAHKKSVCCLNIWIAVSLVVYALAVVQIRNLQVFQEEGSGSYIYIIVAIVILTITYCLNLLIVCVLRREIQKGIYDTRTTHTDTETSDKY